MKPSNEPEFNSQRCILCTHRIGTLWNKEFDRSRDPTCNIDKNYHWIFIARCCQAFKHVNRIV